MINLGQKAKDKVTGFEGTVVGRTEWLNGCYRFTLQPPIDKDGKHCSAETIDEPQLEVVGEGIPHEETPRKHVIQLGQKVRDKITGFEGVAMARTSWLSKLDRIMIQPSVDKEGKHRDGHVFDEVHVEVVGETIPQTERQIGTGGPIPEPVRAADPV